MTMNESSRLSATERRSSLRPGYTLVEVMMALAVLTVGASGIVAMQKFSLGGSLQARNLTAGVNVNAGWLERLNTEAVLWNDANNALVGKGVSVVTAAYLRRFLAFWRAQLDAAPTGSFAVADVVVRHAHDVLAGFVILELGGIAQVTDDLDAGVVELPRALKHLRLELQGVAIGRKVGCHSR